MKYLGKGGFALVFKAKLRLPSGELMPVAMKVLKPKHMSKPSHCRRFLQELAVHTAVHHPYATPLTICRAQHAQYSQQSIDIS